MIKKVLVSVEDRAPYLLPLAITVAICIISISPHLLSSLPKIGRLPKDVREWDVEHDVIAEALLMQVNNLLVTSLSVAFLAQDI